MHLNLVRDGESWVARLGDVLQTRRERLPTDVRRQMRRYFGALEWKGEQAAILVLPDDKGPLYLRLTQDQNTVWGYRLQLVDGPNRTTPIMQSRRYPNPIDARWAARQAFGLLEWQEPLKVGCQLEFVVNVARVSITPLTKGE
jgi:hypothetical protein